MEDRACYRCLTDDIHCTLISNPTEPCDACLNPESNTASQCQNLPSLILALEEAFQTAIQLDTSQWLLREASSDLLLTLDYTSYAPTIHTQHILNDLTYFRSSSSSTEHTARINFLDQFSTFDSRWGGTYERMTGDTLRHAAHHQTQILRQPDSNLPEAERHVLLTALRCLITIHALEEPGGYLPVGQTIWLSANELMVREAKLETHLGGWCAHPRIHFLDVTDYVFTEDVHNGVILVDEPLLEKEPPYYRRYMTVDPGENTLLDQSDMLQALLPAMLSAAQSLLLRRRAQDWPTVFFTLYVLHMIGDDLGRCSDYSDALTKIKRPVKEALRALCALYVHVCPRQYRPFSAEFDGTAYARHLGVETGDMLVCCYVRHDDLWQERIKEDGNAKDETNPSAGAEVDHFMDVLDQYTYGFSL